MASVDRRQLYGTLGAAALAVAGIASILAVAGVAFRQELGVAAASLCAGVFFVPGLYFLGHSRRLRSRETALSHVASFAAAHESITLQDLADELRVSQEDAERILRVAIREGHIRGRFEGRDRFVTDRMPQVEDP